MNSAAIAAGTNSRRIARIFIVVGSTAIEAEIIERMLRAGVASSMSMIGMSSRTG